MSDDRNLEDLQSMPSEVSVDPSLATAQAASAQSSAINNEGQYSSVTGNVSKDEMINISSCEFPEFR